MLSTMEKRSKWQNMFFQCYLDLSSVFVLWCGCYLDLSSIAVTIIKLNWHPQIVARMKAYESTMMYTKNLDFSKNVL